jgi:hypothetical protein
MTKEESKVASAAADDDEPDEWLVASSVLQRTKSR